MIERTSSEFNSDLKHRASNSCPSASFSAVDLDMARDKIVYYLPIAVLHGVTRVRFRAPPRIPRCCWLDAVPGVRPFVPFSQGPEMMPYWTYVKPNSCIISFSRLSAVFVCLFVRLFETFSRLVAFSFSKAQSHSHWTFVGAHAPWPPNSSILARLFCFLCMLACMEGV